MPVDVGSPFGSPDSSVIVGSDHGDQGNAGISVLVYGTKEVSHTDVHRGHDEADVMIEKMGAEQQSARGWRPGRHAPSMSPSSARNLIT
jgi:hypothetical protein